MEIISYFRTVTERKARAGITVLILLYPWKFRLSNRLLPETQITIGYKRYLPYDDIGLVVGRVLFPLFTPLTTAKKAPPLRSFLRKGGITVRHF
jgi:hypothetical protein